MQMLTRTHHREETFAVAPELLFAILHTPSAIRNWWGAARAIVNAQPGGFWAAVWGENEDDPDYIAAAKMVEFAPPRRMVLANYVYHAKSGPLPFEADLATEFEVTPHPEGAILVVNQTGFPMDNTANEFFAACEIGWRNTFMGIRKYLGC